MGHRAHRGAGSRLGAVIPRAAAHAGRAFCSTWAAGGTPTRASAPRPREVAGSCARAAARRPRSRSSISHQRSSRTRGGLRPLRFAGRPATVPCWSGVVRDFFGELHGDLSRQLSPARGCAHSAARCGDDPAVTAAGQFVFGVPRPRKWPQARVRAAHYQPTEWISSGAAGSPGVGASIIVETLASRKPPQGGADFAQESMLRLTSGPTRFTPPRARRRDGGSGRPVSEVFEEEIECRKAADAGT